MLLIRHGQSEFNVHFGKTGKDPGIRDPELTALGRDQAKAAAELLRDHDIRRIVASPYRRAVDTASIIAETLGLRVAIDPVVGERSVFACDIGSSPVELSQRWPDHSFDHLSEEWWPVQEESEQQLAVRCRDFRAQTDETEDRDHLLVVSHWGFILGLTGLPVGNCTIVRYRIVPRIEAMVVYPR